MVYQAVMQFQEYRNAHAIDDDQQDASRHCRRGKAPIQCLLDRDQGPAVGFFQNTARELNLVDDHVYALEI